MLAKKINKWIIATLAVFSVLFLCGFMPYTPDANTVLIDHFDGATSASILAYREAGVVCGLYGGSPKPSATPIWAYGPGPDGLSQALSLNPPSVMYEGGGAETSATGRFNVLNILPGDVVKVDVTKAGYIFTSAYLDSFAPAVNARYMLGTQEGNLFPIATTAGQEEAISASCDGDGTNCLIGIKGDATNHSNITAQLVSQSGTLVGSRISVGRSGSAPTVAFDGINYLMVWADDATHPLVQYGQLISKTGQLVGSPFTIGQSSTNDRGKIIFDGTNYFVVWEMRSDQSSGDTADVYGQFITPSGTLLGSAIPVSTAIHGQRMPYLFFDGTNILVVWADGRNQSACEPLVPPNTISTCYESDVYGQFVKYSSAGVAGSLSGSNFLINASSLPRDGSAPGIVFDGTNYFIVFAEGTTLPNACPPSGCTWHIFGQLVSPVGTAVGGTISIRTQGNQFLPTIGFDGTQYIVAWTDRTNDANGNGACDAGEGTCWDVYGQIISKSGTLIGTAFIINNDAGNQFGFCGGQSVSGKLFCLINTGFDFSQDVWGDVYGVFLDTKSSFYR